MELLISPESEEQNSKEKLETLTSPPIDIQYDERVESIF